MLESIQIIFSSVGFSFWLLLASLRWIHLILNSWIWPLRHRTTHFALWICSLIKFCLDSNPIYFASNFSIMLSLRLFKLLVIVGLKSGQITNNGMVCLIIFSFMGLLLTCCQSRLIRLLQLFVLSGWDSGFHLHLSYSNT